MRVFWTASAIIVCICAVFFFHLAHEADQETYWIVGSIVAIAAISAVNFVWVRYGKQDYES
jgi:membrane protein YdbS with pleckstrin-like domain